MSPDSKKIFPSLLRWLGTGISLILLIYLLGQQGWEEIWRAVQGIPLSYLGIAIVLMLISRLTVAGRWYTLLKSAEQILSPWDTVRLVFAGLFATNFLPTTIGGDVVRLAGAVKRKLNPSIITASLLMDRLVGAVGMASLLPVGLPYLIAAQNDSVPKIQVFLMIAVNPSARIRSWIDKGRGFVISTAKALMIWTKKPTSLLMALVWTYGHQIALFTTLWVLFRGMNQPISWWSVAGLWIFNYFITLLPISINGLGIQELSIAYIYTRFGGVSSDSALVIAILIRILYMLVSLPGVLTLPEIFNFEKQKTTNQVKC